MIEKILISFKVFVTILFLLNNAYATTVNYKLNINKKNVNFTGKEIRALSINNQIPGPTIRAKVGDVLRIEVKNDLDTETSIHWHGVLVPNRMDGVPYINTPPIKASETFFYEFPVKHSGTYWYHAHSALQEQQGMYGSIVFYPENEVKDFEEEHVLVLSDWTDEPPEQVLANIKKEPEYYALKKDSVQSWLKILKNGSKALKIRFNNALNRMGPMDLSDIGYDAFLVNGKKSIDLSHAKPGTRIKLRIINAASSSYFILEYSGGAMEVIESDGNKVEPFTARRIRISMAETYDVIVSVPDNKKYEFRASSEDGTGFAIAHIGQGDLVPTLTFAKPNLALMNMGGMDQASMSGMHEMNNMQISENARNESKMGAVQINNKAKKMEMKAMDMSKMNHSLKSEEDSKVTSSNMGMEDMKGMNYSSYQEMNMNTLPFIDTKELRHIDFLNDYKAIRSPFVTNLPKNNPNRTITLRLTGSMERYVWTVNDIPMYAADKIIIKKGENVKFILINETMMNHPIHLHGHFFRILNGQDDYSPLKHTVNVSPLETIEIEFEANEEKDWIFHCHNLYHMKLGMGGVIHYDGTKTDSDLMDHDDKHSAEHGNYWFHKTEIKALSNFAMVNTTFMRNNDYIIVDGRHNYTRDYESEIIYKRYVSQFLGMYVGGDFKKENSKISNKGIVGIEYTLPLLIKTDLRLNTNGRFRFGFSNEHQLTDRISFEWNWNIDKEYTLNLNYAITKKLNISGNYDSREKFGIGIGIRF